MKRCKSVKISKMETGNLKRQRNDMYLPEETVTDILSRLPAKSLKRCRLVCKRWNNLIRNPEFIKIHLNHPRNPTRLLTVMNKGDNNYALTLFSDESLSHGQSIRRNLRNKRNERKDIRVILGPVNGLYYISYCYSYHDSIALYHALWNPVTSELRHIPPSYFRYTPQLKHQNEYFGFGSAGEDIKVVIIVKHYIRHEFHEVKIRLYSFNDDSWKDLQYDSVSFPFDIANSNPCHNHNAFTHLNEVYYWLARTRRSDGIDSEDILFLFDMKSEEFRRVNLPTISRDMNVESICLRDNSSIVLFVNENSYGNARLVHLWEMKEEGQWLKLLSIDRLSIFGSSDIRTRRFWEKDEILITTKDKKVVQFNMNSHETRNLKIDGSNPIFLLDYKESLRYVRR